MALTTKVCPRILAKDKSRFLGPSYELGIDGSCENEELEWNINMHAMIGPTMLTPL